jgi:hypothetical protein
MEKKPVLFVIKCSGIGILVLSLIEIFNLLILSITELNLGGTPLTILRLILESGNFSFSRALIWIILGIVSSCFLLYGLLLFFFARKEAINNATLAKYLLVFGMIFLINSFIKLEYIVLLGKTEIPVGTELYSFQQVLYTSSITPPTTGLMWYFFTVVACCYLLCGLVYAGSGLSWIIKIENEEAKSKGDNSQEK